MSKSKIAELSIKIINQAEGGNTNLYLKDLITTTLADLLDDLKMDTLTEETTDKLAVLLEVIEMEIKQHTKEDKQ